MPIQLTLIGSSGGYPPRPISVKVTGILRRFANFLNASVASDIIIPPPPKTMGLFEFIINFAAFLISTDFASLGIL